MKRSATTFIETAMTGDVVTSAQTTRAEAIARLGGDQVAIVECREHADGARVGVTWRREWDEPAPAAAARPARRPAKPKAKRKKGKR